MLWDQILETKIFLIYPIAPEVTSFQLPETAMNSQSANTDTPTSNDERGMIFQSPLQVYPRQSESFLIHLHCCAS